MINLNDTLKSKTGEVPPGFEDSVTLRVKKSEFKINSKEKPMTTLTCEIVEPEKVRGVDGAEYDLTSLEVPVWLIYSDIKSEGQRQSGLQQVADFHKKLGLPMEIDENNPDRKVYEGLVFRAKIVSKERTMQRVSGVNEDGVKVRENIKGEDGQAIKQGYQFSVNLQDVIGLGKYTGNRAF